MRLFHLVKKELIEIIRQREMLILLFLAPVLQIIILGYVITTDVKNIPVEIVNLSTKHASLEMISRIKASPQFQIRKISTRPQDYLSILKEGKTKAILVLRDPPAPAPGFEKNPEMQIIMDGVDSNTSLLAAGYFNGILKNYLLAESKRRGQELPVENQTVIRYNPELRSINYMGPGIVALLLTILTMILTSLSLVREKEQQTMDTLLVSRLTPLEIYLGKAIPAAIIGLLDMLIGVAVVVLWFGIPIHGNLLYLFLAALIYISAILSYALLISTISVNQQQAMFFAWFSMVSFLMLSGFFTPIENIPVAIRILADINPLRYLMKIIREIFLKGNGIGFFWKDLVIMTAIAAVVISISLANFKRLISK